MTVSEGDIIKLVLDHTYPGAGTALNIFEYTFGGLDRDDASFMEDVAEYFTTGWGAHWQALAPEGAFMDSVSGVIIDIAGVVLRDLGSEIINLEGTAGNEVSPAAVSGYLLANTAIPQVRGSKYVPAIGEASVEQGELSAAALLDLGLLLVEYLNPQVLTGGGTIFPGVLSSRTSQFELFTLQGAIDSRPAYQRRRKVGVGI